MRFFKHKFCLLTILLPIWFINLPAKAQVTIGAQSAPHNFSVLELISNEKGLRLPQLTTEQRDSLKLNELTDPDIIKAAKGLVIYNTDNDCTEFWNGSDWMSLCASVVQTLTVNPAVLVFDATGEPAQNVAVITNIPAGWTVASKPDWITTIPANGNMSAASISVTADINNNSTSREGYIILAAGALNDTIAVTQLEQVAMTGEGTADSPYMICTPQQLDAVRDEPDAYYQLCGNIDLTAYLASGGEGYEKWGASGWMPLGNQVAPFTGSFDGAGYTISGLRINRPTVNEIGLFGLVNSGGTIQNLTVNLTDNVNSSTGRNCGGLVGHLSGSGSVINNCSVTGTGIISGGSYIGGVAGLIDNGSSITGCYASVNISGSNSTGGLVGLVGQSGNGNGSISNCYATGTVTGGGSNIGGLVGQLYNGNLSNCYATNVVNGTGAGSTDVVGGIVGRISTSGSRIINCVALNSSVTAAYGTDVGRVVGIVAGANNTSNNWALDNMPVTLGGGMPKTPLDNSTGSGLDGADVSATDSQTATWWTTASPSGPGWDSSIWIFTDGQLPKLAWQ